MASKLVSRADFARLTGKSRAAITKLTKGKLAPAMVGDRVDVSHPAAAAYLQANGGAAPSAQATSKGKPSRSAPAPPAQPKRRPTKVPAPPPKTRGRKDEAPAPPQRRPAPDVDKVTGYSDDLADWTLAEIVAEFGTLRAYKDALEAHEKLERAKKYRLDNEQTEGNLIERERVRTHVLGFIEASHQRILGDAPKTISRRLLALAKSGTSVEECEKFVRDTLSAILRTARDSAHRNLRRKKSKRPPPDTPDKPPEE